jgi:O-antigen/teichoic acid export membrane protein
LSATLLVLFFGYLFVPIVLPKYVGSIPYFTILSVYGFMVCMYFLFCNYLFYYGNTKNLMYITFGSSIIHLFLSLFLTQYSLFYTTLIYVVSQSLCVGLVYGYSKKILTKELI